MLDRDQSSTWSLHDPGGVRDEKKEAFPIVVDSVPVYPAFSIFANASSCELNPAIRAFKADACICCMGGNCFILGHRGVCKCLCDAKPLGRRSGPYYEAAMDFKGEYVIREKEWKKAVNIQIQNEETSGEKIEEESGFRGAAVVGSVEILRQEFGKKQKGNERKRWERWVSYQRKEEEQRWICRRWSSLPDGTLREEKGCLRQECPQCWKWRRLVAGSTHPFVPVPVQLRWVIKFYEGLSWPQTGPRSYQQEKVHTVDTINLGTTKARKTGKMRTKHFERESSEITPMTMRPGERGPLTEEEEVFGNTFLGYPTERRPEGFRLSLDEETKGEDCDVWFEKSGIRIGDHLTRIQREKTIRLLYTWRQLFITETNQIPITDLVVHSIPTYRGIKPHRARESPVTAEEEAWQLKNLPGMLGSIIGFTQSPWLAKTTFVEKKGSEETRDPVTGFRSSLRMVHTYCALNKATIKSNYPMKRMEPIINGLSKNTRRYFFSGDAANGYYAVPLLAEHAYKTAFNTVMGQCCYLRMGMGLSGSPHTYAMLKDITFGPIPDPYPERSVHEVVGETNDIMEFRYFFDDDYGASDTFEELYKFLNQWYFPRMAWANLTLKPSKAEFMVPTINPLGLTVGRHEVDNPDKPQGVIQKGEERETGCDIEGARKWEWGLKAEPRKRSQLCQFPIPKSYAEVESFLYFTLYVKMFIPGRAEHARVLKESCPMIEDVCKPAGKKKKKGGDLSKEGEEGEQTKKGKERRRGEFNWGEAQQKSFDAIRQSVSGNLCVGNDRLRRHYLAVDVSRYGFGGVFFQLTEEAEVAMGRSGIFKKGSEQIIHYISQRFVDAETQYLWLEREALGVLRSLEEVRWIAVNSKFPIVVYTNRAAMLSLLQGDDVQGRLAGWQMRLSEYTLEIRHVKGQDLGLATGLSRIPYKRMDHPAIKQPDWADVASITTHRTMANCKHQVQVEEVEDVYTRHIREKTSKSPTTLSPAITKRTRRIFQWKGGFNDLRRNEETGLVETGNNGVLVWCDGACRGNGETGAKASIGIYLSPGNPLNRSEWVPLNIKQTNQTAELHAVYRAIQVGRGAAQRYGKKQLIVISDSAYVCKGITIWLDNWELEPSKRVQNIALFEKIDELIEMSHTDGVEVKVWNIPREWNGAADMLANAIFEREEEGKQLESCVAEESESREKEVPEDEDENRLFDALNYKWRIFLNDPWYGEAIWYKLHGSIPHTVKDTRRDRKIKKDASRLVLLDTIEGAVKLIRTEVDGTWAECVRSPQIEQVLRRFHDNHGHFASGIMSRNMVGKFYWPSRLKDIAQWCRSCDSCQRLGPVRPSALLSPVMQLQPMDMLGIDFIGPFNPMSVGEGKYIIIAVDYFSRYLWASVTTSNHGYIVEQFLKNIVRTFGWPISVYLDNGSHFVKGVLPPLLAKHGVKLFSAPITHPRSVGLSERYVQMVLAGLRSKVIADARPDATVQWHQHLPEVVHAINTRFLRVHGYTPSQLLIGFNARMDAWEENVLDDATKKALETHLAVYGVNETPSKQSYDVKMAKVEEMRELARERFLRYQDNQEAAYQGNRFAAPKKGDLVLLRRFVVDKDRGRKLEPRWEGPYLLQKIAKEGISGYLSDLTTQKVKGRYGFDAMKVYIPRDKKGNQGEDVTVIEVAEGLDFLCQGWYEGKQVVNVSKWSVHGVD